MLFVHDTSVTNDICTCHTSNACLVYMAYHYPMAFVHDWPLSNDIKGPFLYCVITQTSYIQTQAKILTKCKTCRQKQVNFPKTRRLQTHPCLHNLNAKYIVLHFVGAQGVDKVSSFLSVW
jgi:hypothetical protein